MRGAFAAVVCASAVGCFFGDLVFLEFFGPLILVPLSLLSFAIVGSLLVVRRAGGPIGWLLGVAGALFGPVYLSGAYGYESLFAGGALPGSEIVVWLGARLGLVTFACVMSAMILFPDGRPPGRTMAILFWAVVALLALGVVSFALADVPAQLPLPNGAEPGAARYVPNPFGVRGRLGDAILLAAKVFNSVPEAMLIAPIALVVRFRRSRGVERQQLKWLMYTAIIAFGLLLIFVLGPRGTVADLAYPAAFVWIGLLPVAIGIAITRYRLYDIDVLIRRTVIYAALSAVLLVAYIAGVGLFQTILAPITAGSGVAVAISTLAVVALFQPLRHRIQAAVDRRFYRRRYDAVRTLDSFAVRLRDEVDLDALRSELITAVGRTVQPTHASLWLRDTP
jgi:hypothetical protein